MKSLKYVTPALLISTSICPCSTKILFTASNTESSLCTSHLMISHAPRAAEICRHSSFNFDSFLALAITVSPCEEKTSARDLPIPVLAPVIQMTRGFLVSIECYCFLPMSVRNSLRVFSSFRKAPSIALVVATEFNFSTPRMIIQRCCASITTATPSG